MSRRAALRIGLLVALASLAGCGLDFFGERESWRDATERACFQQKLVVPSVYERPAREIDGRGACGIEELFCVNAFSRGIVAVTGGDVVFGCLMTYSMEKWIREAVQPAAEARFGMAVTEILTMGTYSCRSRNNVRGDRLSEHAFANAFDVAGFRFQNGMTIRVKPDWRSGDPDAQAFLREVFLSACRYFTTVLGPGSDPLHENHIHVDLAHHDAAGTSRYCRPRIDRPPPPADPGPLLSAAPDAVTPGPDPSLSARAPAVMLPPAPSGPYTPPAPIPLSYAE